MVFIKSYEPFTCVWSCSVQRWERWGWRTPTPGDTPFARMKLTLLQQVSSPVAFLPADHTSHPPPPPPYTQWPETVSVYLNPPFQSCDWVFPVWWCVHWPFDRRKCRCAVECFNILYTRLVQQLLFSWWEILLNITRSSLSSLEDIYITRCRTRSNIVPRF